MKHKKWLGQITKQILKSLKHENKVTTTEWCIKYLIPTCNENVNRNLLLPELLSNPVNKPI